MVQLAERGLASRLRLKHAGLSSTRNSIFGRKGPGISSEIETTRKRIILRSVFLAERGLASRLRLKLVIYFTCYTMQETPKGAWHLV